MNERNIVVANLTGALTLLAGVSLAAAQQSFVGNPGLANVPKTSQIASGHIARYQIPKYQSVTGPSNTSRTFAVVAVRNGNPAGGPTCGIGVTFRYADSHDVCTVSLNVPPKDTGFFCTRSASPYSFPCAIQPGIIAVCSPILTSHTGNAIVTSENKAGCETIQVDAQQYFTRDANDALVDSMTSIRVIKAGTASEGD
jgi:hypothetical protein